MKLFLLFVGECYYPEGGMHDFERSFDTLDEAVSYAETIEWEWMHVFDVEENKIVYAVGGFMYEKGHRPQDPPPPPQPPPMTIEEMKANCKHKYPIEYKYGDQFYCHLCNEWINKID